MNKIYFMQTDINTVSTKDHQTWKIAKKRVAFKYHVLIYVLINIFFWTLWFVNNSNAISREKQFIWPLWLTIFWGIGVFYNYIESYKNKNFLVEKEYKN